MSVPSLQKSGLILFGVFAVCDLILIKADLLQYRYATKPFLMPLLLVFILATVGFKKHTASKCILGAALIAGTIGDILLIGSEENNNVFAYGLASFLLMQVLYSVYFIRMQPFKKENMVSSIILITILYLFSFFFIRFLSPYLGEFKIPVIIYAIIISIMFLSAANLLHSVRARRLAVKYFIPGALLLLMSDSLLALNKFHLREQVLDIAVMASYLSGQLLLAMGFVKHLKKRRPLKKYSDQSNPEKVLLLNR